MPKMQTFTRQGVTSYFVYNDNLATHNALVRAGIEVKDGKVEMTKAQARYWLDMGVIGTLSKEEWDKHMQIAEEPAKLEAKPLGRRETPARDAAL